jgi:hypothetical protein
MFLLNIEVFNIMTPDFPYTSENETKCTILYPKFRNFIWQDFPLFKNFEENLYISHTMHYKSWRFKCFNKNMQNSSYSNIIWDMITSLDEMLHIAFYTYNVLLPRNYCIKFVFQFNLRTWLKVALNTINQIKSKLQFILSFKV